MRRPAGAGRHHQFARTCPVQYGQYVAQYRGRHENHMNQGMTANVRILSQLTLCQKWDAQIHPGNGL